MNGMRALWIGKIKYRVLKVAVVLKGRLKKSLGSCPKNRSLSSSFRMMIDVISVFDATTFTMADYRFLVWVGRFFYMLILVGMVYWYRVGRLEAVFGRLVSLPLGMVKESKMGILGGSHLIIPCLFITLLGVNVVGLLPYSFRVRSHLVFRINFGLSFWLGLIMSRLVLGKLHTSMAKLVFSGIAVVGGMLLCWMEKFRVFLRWITLSVRLVANIRVGQIVSVLLGDLIVIYYFIAEFSYHLPLLLVRGVCVLAAELAVGLVQAYLFCLLLTIYRDDHSI